MKPLLGSYARTTTATAPDAVTGTIAVRESARSENSRLRNENRDLKQRLVAVMTAAKGRLT